MSVRRSRSASPKNGLGQFRDIFEPPVDLDRFKMVDKSSIDRLTTQNLPSFFDRLTIEYDSGDVSVSS